MATTTATTDVYWRIKEDIKNEIIRRHGSDLDVSGLDIGDRVYSDIIPSEEEAKFPCVFVLFADESEEDNAGSSEYKYTITPVRVLLANREAAKRTDREAQYLAWRHQTARLFQDKRLRNVGEVTLCSVRYQKIFDQKLPMYQYLVSGIIVRPFLVEARY